ncbi:MAG: hypothetical protein AAF628_35360 [Planctomycetota bacterium]
MKLSMLAGGLCVTAAVCAQTPDTQEPALKDVLPAQDWMVPIHTQDADPQGGAYGVWAAGPDYKVSFDDGFTYYPVLGPDAPRNLPMRWRTQRISVGGRVVVDEGAQATPAASDWRYELRYPAVTEAYDVLPEGVEQTFVLNQPLGTGDIVVEGRIDSPLHAASVGLADQSLAFVDDAGREVVRYGKALAIDARDRHMPVQTSFDGSTVRLHLASDCLTDAVYPIVIDPLTSTTLVTAIIGGSGAQPSYLSVARDDRHDNIMVAFTRATSATDWDLHVRVYEDDFTYLGAPFTDVSATWSSRHNSVAYVRKADEWVIAIGRGFLANAGIRVYFQPGGVYTQGSGELKFLQVPMGTYEQYPSVGGMTRSSSNDAAYLVFQQDLGARSTPNSRVFGVLVDATNRTLGTRTNLHTTTTVDYDAEWPQVTDTANGGGSWVTVWQEYNYENPNDDWDILAQRIEPDGSFGGIAALGPDRDASRHKLHPIVAGENEEYMVSFIMRPNLDPSSASTGNELAVQRFRWAEDASKPVERKVRVVASRPGDELRAAMGGRAIAFDSKTQSHWAVAYVDGAGDLRVVRTGFRGRIVEEAMVYEHGTVNATPPAVCYNDDDFEFVIGYGLDAPPSSVLVRRLQYSPDAESNFHGTACGGMDISPDNASAPSRPYAGSQHFGFTVSGLANTGTVLFVSPNKAPSLQQIEPGCFFWLDPAATFVAWIGVTDANGDLWVPTPLLDTITFANLHWQAIQAPVAGGLISSQAVETIIR